MIQNNYVKRIGDHVVVIGQDRKERTDIVHGSMN